MTADAVVLATGGFSYPQTGSTGDGYRMAEVVGHRVSSPKPGLVAIVLDDASIAALQGVSLSDGVAVLTRDSRLVASRRGEMLFTHFGVSGPIILSLSLAAAEALQGAPCGLSLDVAPDLTWPLFEAQWRQALSSRPRSRCHSLMHGMLPQALAHFVLARSAIPQERPTNQLSAKERKALYETIKNLRFTVSRTRPIKEAMVTVGGVCTQEIDPHTMASRVVQGLYLAGEIIDVAGDTGGYNLQIAFTTGYLAGESAARAQPDGGAT